MAVKGRALLEGKPRHFFSHCHVANGKVVPHGSRSVALAHCLEGLALTVFFWDCGADSSKSSESKE